jgi:long-chain acyl-CoA synthetase
MAAVTLMPGGEAGAEELVAFAREKVAAYKYPRRVEILEVLPLGPSGKVLKRELVAKFEAEAAQTAEAETAEAGVHPVG